MTGGWHATQGMMGGSEPVSPLDSYADLAERGDGHASAARPPRPPTTADAAVPAEFSPDPSLDPSNPNTRSGGGSAAGAAVAVPGNGGGSGGGGAANSRGPAADSYGGNALGAAARELAGSAPARLGGAQDLAEALETVSLSSGAHRRLPPLCSQAPSLFAHMIIGGFDMALSRCV